MLITNLNSLFWLLYYGLRWEVRVYTTFNILLTNKLSTLISISSTSSTFSTSSSRGHSQHCLSQSEQKKITALYRFWKWPITSTSIPLPFPSLPPFFPSSPLLPFPSLPSLSHSLLLLPSFPLPSPPLQTVNKVVIRYKKRGKNYKKCGISEEYF